MRRSVAFLSVRATAHRAVILDLGGVVLPSPFAAFRAYERRHGVPYRFVSEVIVRGGEHGAWARFERGELGLEEFAVAFETECKAAGGRVTVADLLAAMAADASGPHPEMATAIRRRRAVRLRTGALTNNWIGADRPSALRGDSPLAAQLVGLFDAIVESARVGLRKPDPRIYRLACEELGVAPHEAVFLDDLRANLKPARAMGMTTIKVDDPLTAAAQLGAVLGLDLLGA